MSALRRYDANGIDGSNDLRALSWGASPFGADGGGWVVSVVASARRLTLLLERFADDSPPCASPPVAAGAAPGIVVPPVCAACCCSGVGAGMSSTFMRVRGLPRGRFGAPGGSSGSGDGDLRILFPNSSSTSIFHPFQPRRCFFLGAAPAGVLGPASLEKVAVPFEVADGGAVGEAVLPAPRTRLNELESAAEEDVTIGGGARERRLLDEARSRVTLDAREEDAGGALADGGSFAAVGAGVEVRWSLGAVAAACALGAGEADAGWADGMSDALVAQRGARGGLIAGRGGDGLGNRAEWRKRDGKWDGGGRVGALWEVGVVESGRLWLWLAGWAARRRRRRRRR